MAKRKAQTTEPAIDATTNRRSTRRSSAKAGVSSQEVETKPAKKAKTEKGDKAIDDGKSTAKQISKSSPQSPKPVSQLKKTETTALKVNAPPQGQQYWLMKAEPESRLEKGHDIKFSIDDLAAKTEPEPWDGIRAFPARNNLRAMKRGDLAFFYHSSCKIPAIVGIMEIVGEHEPDLTAQDPSAPYYDPKDIPDNPKWSIVRVEFRRKLKEPITLKELREYATVGPLANMQMLKQTRLSVSKVGTEEWKFLIGVVEEREGDTENEK